MGYSGVVVALTMLRAFYTIGDLWDPAKQMRRSLQLVPFDTLTNATSWLKPVYEYGGNTLLFIPLGMLVYILYRPGPRPLLATALVGAGFSLIVETWQFLFGLGYSDIDDLVLNTLGAFIGAVLAKLCGPRFHSLWALSLIHI